MKYLSVEGKRTRFKMFTRWLTFTALLASSLNSGSLGSGWGSVTFESTCRVKGEPEEKLIFHCGDGKYEGAVQFWHTPFGDLQSSGSQSNLDSVFIHHDGNLVIPNSSIHHSGLYYCILLHTDGSTLWPYELHVGVNQKTVEDEDKRSVGCSAHRFRRSAGFPERNQAAISDETYAGAVAASVLLTFLVGFSAGALLRSRVLRCLQAFRVRMSRKKRQHQPDVPDGSRVTMTTLPPMYDNQAFKTEAMQHDAPLPRSTETPVLLTTPSPPAKPKRSFRSREEKQEGAAYLEGCDYNRGEKMKEGGENEAEEEESPKLSVYVQEDEGSRSETEDDSRMVKKGGAGKRSREEDGGQETEEVAQSPPETDDETSNNSEDDTAKEGPPPSSSRRRRSRVIRLYQYDEDGQRYGHLPDPAPQAPEPAPRLKHRSLSLTRLNAIMAAASTGPMESGKEQGEEQGFQMKI